MKRSFLGVVVLFVALVSFSAEKKNTVLGTWELVSAKYTSAGNTQTNTGREIKIITKNHWAFLYQGSDRQKFAGQGTDAELLNAAKTFNAGGGTYTLKGDTYTEQIELSIVPNLVNVSIPFKIKWEGDQWIQTGTLPLKSMGLGENDIELYEVWKRIE